MTEKPTDDFAFLADNYKVFLFDSPQKPVNNLRLGFGQRSNTVWRIFSAKGDSPLLASLKNFAEFGGGVGLN